MPVLTQCPAGDLYVYISVRPHTIFERGDDIWCVRCLTFTQAALGAEVTVPTLTARVAYRTRRDPA